MVPKFLVPTPGDIELAKEARRRLASLADDGNQRVSVTIERAGETHRIGLPPAMAGILLEALVHLSDGKAVAVIDKEAELDVVDAAEVLNVSRAFLVDLVESGAIPFRGTGTDRRILLVDLCTYKSADDDRRRGILDRLAANDQAMGLV